MEALDTLKYINENSKHVFVDKENISRYLDTINDWNYHYWLENETVTLTEKELIIFRDSYGSSLAPLLIPYYSKITLIDLRYINYDIVANLTDFEHKDVLFIYSAQVINNSNLLKVNDF